MSTSPESYDGHHQGSASDNSTTAYSGGLGDRIHYGLSLLGVTPERVEKWVGKPCGCNQRRDKLNILGNLIGRFLSGKTEGAREYLERLISSK